MTEQDKLQKKFDDPQFIAELKKCSSEEDAAKLFTENGIELDARTLSAMLKTFCAVQSGEIKFTEDVEEDELSDDLAEEVAGGNSDMVDPFAQLNAVFSVMLNNPMVVSILIENFGDEKSVATANNIRKVAFIMEEYGHIPLAKQTMQMATQTMQYIRSQGG